ncbi:MAG: hypothetical protein EA386_04590 [Rhodobacteraceae bacterium]|nr:MAG: hypothetical protein EA386_04590 [Paracoccaceae bacterium]
MTASPHIAAALVVAGVATGAGLALSSPPPSPEPLVCELTLTEARRQVTVTAEAHARRPVQGTYVLEIDQRSAGGTSTIRQGGDFDLSAHEAAILATTRLSGRKRDVDARLTVTANGQTRTCSAITL